jgi:hypothetical protein
MHKTIIGFPNYEIYDDGMVYSKITNKFLKPSICGGYPTVELFYGRNKSKRKFIHRLVAEAFIPNPDGLPMINHKDENRKNPHVSNLEWCTAKYNQNYGTCIERRKLNTDYSKQIYKDTAKYAIQFWKKPVLQFSKDGEFIARYESAQEAGRINKCHGGHITECCKGKRYKTVGGYIWKLEKEE